MAISGKAEDRVGSNSSLSTPTVAAEPLSSQSPAAFLSSHSPTIVSLSSSSSSPSFQSISSELDGQLKACPPTTSSTSADSTELLALLPKWESWWWKWCARPNTTSTTTLPPSTSIITGASSTQTFRQQHHHHSSHREHEVYEDFQRPPSHHHRRHHYRQRLNSLTIHLTVVLIFTTFACFPSLVGSATSTSGQDENERLVCMKGISNGFPGVTYPRGDILLREGDTLEVFCKLNLTDPAAEGLNASSIDFIFTKADYSADQVEKRVINETTAVVRVKNLNSSNPYLQCVLRRPNGSYIHVCQNQIDVGLPPLPVENFRCVSQKWKKLNCTWKLPWNPIRTKYTIIHLAGKGRTNFINPCPENTTTPTSCVWGERTEPHYRQNEDPIRMQLNGTNALKPSGNTWEYKFYLASILIPDKPIVHVLKKAPFQYLLNWTFDYYEYFPPGLNHELSICYLSNGKEECNVTMHKTRPVEGKMTPYYTKPFSPYAHTNYTISVRLRSPGTEETEEWWSEPGVATLLTDSRAPDFPPETDIGSFEAISAGPDFRHIYLYWKSIPDHLKNGPGFNYTIDVYENKSELLSIAPDELTELYARYDHLKSSSSYHFYITAYNSIGKSRNASEITVQSVDKLPGEPQFVSMLFFNNGSVDTSWRRPGRYQGIVSYTVFRCSKNKPRPACEDLMEWDRLDATKFETMHKFYDNLSQDINYNFAVSANTDKYGSGMVWAACSLYHGRVPQKLKSIRFEDPKEDEILIKWNLDCAYQSGDIEGFKITYCEVDKYQAENCKDEKRSEAVEGANITTYRLMDLKPYSIYMIYVEILAAAGPSPRSDFVYARTSEGAPSPVTIFNVSEVTNVTAVLNIRSPERLNGLLREYKIYYWPNGESRNPAQMLLRLSNETQRDGFLTQGTLENLRSNSEYTVTVVACTTKCSNDSKTFTFNTDIGYTNITKYPEMSLQNGKINLKWGKPDHVGGPISRFQIMLKRNGEHVPDDDEYRVKDYEEGQESFSLKLGQECEPGTNFTAQVRALTRLSNGNYIYGGWSPPASFMCGGSNWLLWVTLAVVALVGIVVVGYASFRGYNYFRRMKEGLAIKLPPGLNSELNGFAHKTPPRSRSNDNGKEMYAYPLQPTSTQLDESKDFLSSSDLNQGEAEESLIEKPYCPSPTNPLLGGLDFSTISGGDGNTLEDEENEIRLTDFSNLHPDRCSSPTTYKKLGVQSNGSAVLIEPMPGPSSRSTPSINSINESGGDLSTSSPSHNTISQISNHLPPFSSPPILPTTSHHPPPLPPASCNGINRTAPDVLSSSPSSPISSLNSSILPPPVAVVSPSSRNNIAAAAAPPAPHPVAPPTSSYVKWTTLVPDMKTGDAGGVLENGSRQSPYCQVGILLDS